MKGQRAFLAAATVLSGLLASGCGTSQQAGTPTGPIKIGYVADLTGSGASFSVPFTKGVPLAIDEINAKGGINGRKVQSFIEDTGSKPQGAIDAATKLINVDKVDVIIGEAQSSNFVPMAQYAATHNSFPVVNGGSSSPQIRHLPGTIISTLSLDDQVAGALATWVYQKGFRRMATVVGNEPYGLGVATAVSDKFKSLGGTVVAQVAPQLSQSDYRPELQRVAAANPDVVVNATFGSDAQLQFRQLVELGVKAPWYDMYPTVVGLDSFMPAWGHFFGLEIGWLKSADYISKYHAKYGEDPSVPWSALAYDSTWLTAQAVGNAKDQSPQAFINSFLNAAKTYSGPFGTFEFDSTHTRTNQIFDKLALVNGKFEESN